MNHSATYSPEDNKLRLYPAYRLDKDEYNRVKAAGFKWAPKQELFVAPMWTPDREDLLLEMCGSVDDEDTSLVERQEQRAERFEQYSDNRAEDAERAHAAVSAIADNIPLGQPILVGHHSEKRARKDAEKIENGMRKAVNCWKASEYWKDRAHGAISHAKYKERPDVRTRRIKTIESDKRRQEKNVAEAKLFLELWANDAGAVRVKDPSKNTFWNRAKFITNRDHISKKFSLAEFPRPEGASTYEDWMSLWSALGDSEDGSEGQPGFVTPGQARDIAVRVHNGTIARASRWIEHYDNRIAYEKEMLRDAGGIATDHKQMEAGGAVRVKLWSPGYGKGFAYIQKVNRVTVTILHRWQYSQKPHRHNATFDDVLEVMTRAEVEEAKAAGRIQEDDCGFFLLDTPPDPRPFEEEKTESAAKFEQMAQTLKAGVQVVTAPQLFPTPPDLAARMVEIAELGPGQEALEPSAGTGNICRAIQQAGARVFAVELNSRLAGLLAQTITPPADAAEGICKNLLEGDFLEQNGNLGKFDAVVMNPPFENAVDIKHITHAIGFLKPGGRLVALCANGPRQNEQLRPIVEEHGGTWEPLPAGTFKDQGTNVNTVLLSMTLPIPEPADFGLVVDPVEVCEDLGIEFKLEPEPIGSIQGSLFD